MGMNTETADTLAAAPKNYVCTKCNGSGNYLHFGTCFDCKGTGRVKASRKAAKFVPVKQALATLRSIYTASVKPSRDTWSDNLNDSCTSAYSYGVDAFRGLLAEGDVEAAEKAFRAFSAIPRNGRHFANHIAFHACHMREWGCYSGAAQRKALELAGITAPLTFDKRGTLVPCEKFGFNDE